MTMFTTYFDASGTRYDSDVIAVAGFVSAVEQWLKFEEEWNRALAEFGVPYLHMKEFAHFSGPFKSWREDEKKRRAFLERLSNIIARRARKSFCRAIRVGDFDAVDVDYPVRELFGSPLALAGLACVDAVRIWQKQYDAGPNLFIFEDGDSDRESLTRALKVFLDVNPIYRTKVEHVEFQAADWAAYEHRNLSSDWIQNNRVFTAKSYRRSATILYDKIPNDWGDLGAPELLRILSERLVVPPRSTSPVPDSSC